MFEKREGPIGIFDSGIGGLTVVREVMRILPEEPIAYFGDTARVPYGSKSKETILGYSRQIVRFLESRRVKAIVVACNTASALALEEIRREWDIPMIGVVQPGAVAACRATTNGRIGVIGTKGTIASGIYGDYIQKLRPGTRVIGKACPLFVPLVEEHMWEDPLTREMARRYLAPLQEEGIDTLILGCTHYPLLRDVIGEVAGSGVALVNPAHETAVAVADLLREAGLLRASAMERRAGNCPCAHQMFVSDAAESFRSLADAILPVEIEKAQIVHIEEYASAPGPNAGDGKRSMS